jgi:hypothetical protein
MTTFNEGIQFGSSSFMTFIYPLVAGHESVMLFFVLSGFVLRFPDEDREAVRVFHLPPAMHSSDLWAISRCLRTGYCRPCKMA